MKTELALLLTNDSPLMTLVAVAELFGLNPRTLKNKIYAKECPVPMFQVAGQWVAHISDVAKYIDDQRESPRVQ